MLRVRVEVRIRVDPIPHTAMAFAKLRSVDVGQAVPVWNRQDLAADDQST